MSASNPMHRSINAGNTRRNEKKLERSWEELQSEKKHYIVNKRDMEEMKRKIAEYFDKRFRKDQEDTWYDDSAK